ncbi:MAG TPA: hypothetical protein VGO47_09365 [Chlamydiales bacterium]|nr:hypothetical protein [Chlamydiales bacterium]
MDERAKSATQNEQRVAGDTPGSSERGCSCLRHGRKSKEISTYLQALCGNTDPEPGKNRSSESGEK